MKYWTFLLAKLAMAGGSLYGIWLGLYSWFPYSPSGRFGRDLPWTATMLVYWLFCIGALYLIVRDQQYRCRTCLRRLRMPVARGSWNYVFLLGPPRTEYICPYGHGTLKVPELQIAGIEMSDWQPHEDIWKELMGLEETRR